MDRILAILFLLLEIDLVCLYLIGKRLKNLDVRKPSYFKPKRNFFMKLVPSIGN
jgi:hypothetical protein